MTTESPPILVTGAGRGIGTQLCQRLLADGQTVIAHYRSKTDVIETLAAKGADCLPANFTDNAAVHRLTETIRSRYTQLRGIVHNASAFGHTHPEPEQAAAQFQSYFAVHMQAPYLINRALAGLLARGDAPGDIIHITDIYADNPAPEYATYCATKAGAQNLALSFAKALAPQVKVNVIQPGPIDFNAWHGDTVREHILANTPMGRTGSPDNIYQALRQILDNSYMTGAVIPVDGGRRLGR